MQRCLAAIAALTSLTACVASSTSSPDDDVTTTSSDPSALTSPDGCPQWVRNDGNGQVMTHPRIQFVYLGSFYSGDTNWQTNGVDLWPLLDQTWKMSAADPRLYQPDFEYTGSNGRVGPGEWDGSIFHSYGSGSASVNIDTDGIIAILQQEIAAGRLLHPDVNTLYVVVTGPYIYEWHDIEQGWGGFHGSRTMPDGSPLVFAVVSGMRANQGANRFSRLNYIIGHEVREAVSDPLNNAWYDTDGAHEVGDLCEGSAAPTEYIDLASMNASWSQRSCGCTPATYITDGGFEWQSGNALAWPWVTEGNSVFWIDPDENDSWEGHKSLFMTATNDWAGVAQHVPVKPHTKYKLTADINTSPNLTDLYFGVRSSNGVQRGGIIVENKLGPLTDPYAASQAVTFDSGDNHWIYVYAGFYPTGGTSWAQVDAFQLSEVSRVIIGH